MDNLAKFSNQVFYAAASAEGASLLNLVLGKLQIAFSQQRHSEKKGIQIRFYVAVKDDPIILTEIDKFLALIKYDNRRCSDYNHTVARYEMIFLPLGDLYN